MINVSADVKHWAFLCEYYAVDITFLSHRCSYRFGRICGVPSALIMAAALAIIPFTNDLAGLYMAAILNGFGNGLGSGVMLTIGADLAPSGARGEFLGLWSLIGDAGATGGPLVVGGIADILALQPATWAIAAVGFAAAAVFGFLVPETLVKKKV